VPFRNIDDEPVVSNEKQKTKEDTKRGTDLVDEILTMIVTQFLRPDHSVEVRLHQFLYGSVRAIQCRSPYSFIAHVYGLERNGARAECSLG
jgi:hypothetical protein